MTIRHRCEQCGRLLSIPVELTGTLNRCPACRAEFVVPPATAGEVSPAREPPVASPDPPVAPDSTAAAGKVPQDFDPVAFLMDGDTAKAPEVHVPDSGNRPSLPAPPSRRKWSSRTEAVSGQEAAATNAKGLLRRSRADARRKSGDPTATIREEPGEQPGLKAVIRKLGAAKLAMIVVFLGVGVTTAWWFSRLRFDVPPLGKVSGRVTLDGEPLSGAIVNFLPLEKKFRKDRREKHSIAVRTASGVTDADGRYTLSYIESYSGTSVGKNLVYLAPLMNEKGRDRIPASWSVSSLGSPEQVKTVDIVEGRNPDFDIEMKSDSAN